MKNPFQFLKKSEQPALHLADLTAGGTRLLTLDERLELAFKAIAHAKDKCPRSANQWYFKNLNPWAERERAEFLVSLARGAPPDPFRKEMERKVNEIVNDPNLSQTEKNGRIDKLIQGLKNLRPNVPRPDHNGASLFTWGVQRERALLSDLRDDVEFGKRTGLLLANDYIESERVKQISEWASNAGAGNCKEKSALTVQYLRQNTPPGHHIAWLSFDEGYKNGDHAFCVLGTAQALASNSATNIGQWGSEAVLIDGWMNDAYPVTQPFAWKYGYNYKGVRINPFQLNMRNRVCVTFRDHIKVMGAWTT